MIINIIQYRVFTTHSVVSMKSNSIAVNRRIITNKCENEPLLFQ